MAIADTYDAITSSRAYRRARGQEAALAEIERCSGTQFDPDLASLFLEICRPPGGGCAPFRFEERRPARRGARLTAATEATARPSRPTTRETRDGNDDAAEEPGVLRGIAAHGGHAWRFSPGRGTTRYVPEDEHHPRPLVVALCRDCHAPGQDGAAAGQHPPKEQCMLCHRDQTKKP